ncbi:MAG: transglutaminase [Deltaproteobacteria bacterium]|nr:transglutaminase [Deltaproteobacteria bacterium]
MKIGFHKDIFKPSLLKSIAVFLIFVFAWTNLGIYQVVYAATANSGEHQVASSERNNNREFSGFPPDKGDARGLETLVTRIRERSEKAESKIQQVGIKSEQAGFQKEKSELEQADINIRAQFKQTEQRIKGLPAVIQQRQKAFERKYEKNLAQLKSELDSINTAKTNTQFTARTRKLKVFLDKIKPPSRHIKFNPNKLPHRMVHPVRKLTFTKLESPDQAIAKSTASSNGVKPVWRSPGKLYSASSFLRKQESRETKDWIPYQVRNDSNNNIGDIPQSVIPMKTGIQNPIQLASIGSLNGILSSAIVQTIPPPTAADLTSTVEVQFTPAILAKAAELNHNPVQIYNWVYNNIEYVPTYGSIQGADMCLQTMQCNDMDTASLLIALLRASNIPARYVYGTIQLPINKIMNWVGGFTDAKSALELMAQGGIPITGEVAGGKIVAAKIEHAWVEAYVNYFPSRGARNGPGNEWIPLDASYKQYTYTQGMNITQAVPFDAQSFINQITSTATINTQQGYVTNINAAYISQTIANYQAQVANYISQTNPNATVGDVIGKKTIIQQNFPYLLGTIPYQVLAKGWEASEVPDNLRYKISFQITNPQTLQTDINYTVSLAQIAGKRLTLSYVPATSADEAVIESYMPTGSSITISSLPTSLPAYLIKMVPQLMVDGQVVATGSSIGLGGSETLTMTFTDANQYADTATTNLTAGEYYGIGIDAGGVSSQTVLNLKNALSTIQTRLQSQDFTGMTKDDIFGSLLYTTAVSYYAEYDMMDWTQAREMGVVIARIPSEAVFSVTMNVSYMFGVATNISPSGLKMDVQRNLELTQASDGDNNKVIQYMFASGMNSSALENNVPEQLFFMSNNPVQGISAIKAIQIANDEGIPIYTVNQSNISTVLPQLQLPSDVISDIQNAVNAGEVVTVPQMQITYNGWTGVGYIIIDPTTGAGAYMISGGLGGAMILMLALGFALLALAIAAGPIIFAIAALLLPAYLSLIGWLILEASPTARACVLALTMVAVFFLFELWMVDPIIEVLLAAIIPTAGIEQIISILELARELPEIGNKCFGTSP